jgi:predicted extracellular nuclease
VYGGGGNTGSHYASDFIEVTNRGPSAVDLTGWTVQYRSGTGSTWATTALTGSIDAGELYLVQEASGSSGDQAALPTPQVTGGIALSSSSGVVALVHSLDALACSDSPTCVAASVDLVGYGTANTAETAPVTGASNTASVQRTTAADTDNNADDFTAAAPTPAAANTGGGGGGGTPGPLRIHDIQGDGWLSPQAGQVVTNVPGVVTAVRTSGTKGFWFQDPDRTTIPRRAKGSSSTPRPPTRRGTPCWCPAPSRTTTRSRAGRP